MPSNVKITVAAYGILSLAGAFALMMPETLTMPRASGQAVPPSMYRLPGVVRDFPSSHPDFGITPAAGLGHYAGNVAAQLGGEGRPEFIGLGSIAYGEIEGSAGYVGPFGYATAFADNRADVRNKQIGTRFTLPANVTVTSIKAYVGMDDHYVRYAIYSDNSGEPGDRIVQSNRERSNGSAMDWLEIEVPPTALEPGVYWLALALEDRDQRYAYAASGGTTRILNREAVDNGFRSTWGPSDGSSSERVAIYANFIDHSGDENFGYQPILATSKKNVGHRQIATRVTMPEFGTLVSITAHVGNDRDDVRYAIYQDNGGEPGALIVQTENDESSSSSMEWLTLYVPDTPLPGGNYWLAVSLDGNDQEIRAGLLGGATRYKNHTATDYGFLPNWGASNSTTTEQISIYATYVNGAGVAKINGFKVLDPWLDASYRPIAPHLFGAASDYAIDFVIDGDQVIPEDEFAVELRVLGAAIQNSSYHRPVTMQIIVNGVVFEPFGPYDNPVAGNLNDDQTITCNSNGTNPRCASLPGTFAGTSVINIAGRSWVLEGSGDNCQPDQWEVAMQAETIIDSPQIMALRNGDPVPNIRAMYSQESIADYVADYVDLDTGLMRLAENQIIYLFELGQTGTSSSADFQDLVVLMTLAEDLTGMCGVEPPIGNALCGSAFGDVAGTAIPGGEIDASGGVSSTSSFDEWYRDVLGMNLSALHTITLVDNGSGVYEYLDDQFHPIDGKLLGNEAQAHNHYFTYAIHASFVYSQCAGQFFEFFGNDDAWLFINGKLVMDLGGISNSKRQYVDVDRLNLTGGETYDLMLFYAQRQSGMADFNIRTNLLLRSRQALVTEPYD